MPVAKRGFHFVALQHSQPGKLLEFTKLIKNYEGAPFRKVDFLNDFAKVRCLFPISELLGNLLQRMGRRIDEHGEHILNSPQYLSRQLLSLPVLRNCAHLWAKKSRWRNCE